MFVRRPLTPFCALFILTAVNKLVLKDNLKIVDFLNDLTSSSELLFRHRLTPDLHLGPVWSSWTILGAGAPNPEAGVFLCVPDSWFQFPIRGEASVNTCAGGLWDLSFLYLRPVLCRSARP